MCRQVVSGVFVLCLVLVARLALADQNEVRITVSDGQRCVTSNGLPDHATGSFPNPGNPHTMTAQSVRLCMPSAPVRTARVTRLRGAVGIAVNGVHIRPGTADWYDPSSPRGHSRDSASGWNLEGMGSARTLGIDFNAGHVDHSGLYHYHGISPDLVASARGGTLIGWAADGHEIHYVGRRQRSSWQLIQGVRPTAPHGRYDGRYNEDWEHVAGSGSLDQCNGGSLNGKFVYFATATYPFYPRCAWGRVSADFNGRRGSADGSRGRPARDGGNRSEGQRRGPPSQALAACSGRSVGTTCSFTGRGGRTVRGTCFRPPDDRIACRPKRH